MISQDEIAFAFALIISSFFAVIALTGWLRGLLIRKAIIDIPNDRSSHTVPVPRGGGWALVIVLLPILAAYAALYDQDTHHAGVMAALALLVGISWVDDKRNVSPAIRLALHLLAAFLGSLSFSASDLLLGGWLPLWADRMIMIVGWGWFINLYNFMDGIDGITSAETISIATGLCLTLAASGIDDSFVDVASLVMTGACLGFLAHNWHPAKIFLGDVGSVPLGFLTGFGLLLLAVKGHQVAALILPLYYLADSGITITRRALRGEKVWKPHREHFYQKAAMGAGSHSVVVTQIIVANIGLIGAALVAIPHPLHGVALGFLIVAILLFKMHKTASQPKANHP